MEWSEDFNNIIKAIKEKREETKRKRNVVFLPLGMKTFVTQISAKTIGLDLVAVQPMSAPTTHFNYEYIDEKAKYKKRKKVIDKLLGKEVKNNKIIMVCSKTFQKIKSLIFKKSE